MLKTSKMLTITVPKGMYKKIKSEAKKRNSTVSGLIQDAFESYTDPSYRIYSDNELASMLKRDSLSPSFQNDLDKILA